MKSLLSGLAALAVILGAGTALAQDEPAAAPAKHHHAKKHSEAGTTGEATEIHSGMPESRAGGLTGERTEHGGPPSSPVEKSETEKLNDQQLGHS